ncbi:D-alanyl-D-alanine carboxypeptidase family protein [Candidatus Thiosymbion oneisti]|uniref:D-alanyl-D-alanine carboxypeptidase family protein n=1 Tax=Candidatus Thiosymbion oneisti TaxID=589554 RepID=UPI000AAC5696
MKPLFHVSALLILFFSAGIRAGDMPVPDAPTPVRAPDEMPIPDPPQLAAKSYLLVDHNSGKVLVESNADERLEPASLTKIMTAYVVFRELGGGNLSLRDQVLISERAWRTGGSKTFIEIGKQVSVEDLLKGMIIQSGNDASVALAEHIGGTEETFADLMNTHARRIGMKNSNFTNATGLPHEDHYTTARDIALVTAASIREFPEYYAWYAVKEFTYNRIKQRNRNRLLWRDESVDGVKTGYTKTAGYCLVASAERGNMRLTSVVMGSQGEAVRTQASLALLNYGFRFYETHKLYAGGQRIETLRIWMGEVEDLPVGPAEDVSVTIPRRTYDKLSAKLVKDRDISAPIVKGAVVGHISIALEGKEVRRVPLVALRDVAEGGILQKGKDAVLKWF